MGKMRYFKNTKSWEILAYEDSLLKSIDDLLESGEALDEILESIHNKVKDSVEIKEEDLEKELKGMATPRDVRDERDSLLLELDRFTSNPFRMEELSEEDKIALRGYRKLLLDVPQQKGFPKNVIFPRKPKCLC